MTDRELQVHFLVGMNRTGITWLSRALNLHPALAVFGQSRFWGKHFLQPDADGNYQVDQRNRWLKKIDDFEWNATIGDEIGCFLGVSVEEFRHDLSTAVEEVPLPTVPAELFLAIARAVARRKDASIVLEKTPHHVLHVERITRAFPAARFVVLTCDPNEYARSLKAQHDLLYHPAACALMWRRYDAAIHELRRRFPDRSVVVRYNDLVRDPSPELRRIMEFLGVANIDPAPSLPNFYHGFHSGDSLPELTAGDRFWTRWINQTLDHNDFSRAETRAAFADVGSVAGSILRLPTFFVRHLWRNLSDVQGSWLAYYRKWLTLKEHAP